MRKCEERGRMDKDAGAVTYVISEDPDFLEELSEYLDVLSSTTRLKILKSIERKPKDIREISSEIETSYENTKKHLDKLLKTGVIKKEAGLSKPTSKGIHPVWKYSLIPGGMEAIIRNLGLFSNISISLSNEALVQRLDEVKEMFAEEMEGQGGSTPFLMILGGSEDGRIYPLKGSTLRIGRYDPEMPARLNSDEDIVLPEEYGAVTRISKPHAVFIKVKGAWHIEDCGSTGGTFVNMIQVEHGQRILLHDGDLIFFSKGVKGAQFVVTIPSSPSS